MKISFRLAIVVMLLGVVGVNSQDLVTSDFNFKHLSSKEGLSQRSVTSIVQDNKGYLWFGTRDGLNKYDGNKTIVYRHNSEDAHSLTHSWITVIYQDSKQSLWLGTKDGLNKYNPEEGDFIQYKHVKGNNNSIAHDEIWGITQLNDTTLCVGTNNGLNFLNLKNNKVTTFSTGVKSIPASLNSKKVRALLKTSHGDLWVCTTKGINVFSAASNTVLSYNYPRVLGEDFRENNAPTLFEDRYKNIWLGYKNGLAFFNKEKEVFVDYTINGKLITDSHVRTISEDDLGNLWVGTYKGLCILNEKNQTVRHVVHNKNNPKSLSQNSIYKITKDSRGDMWIGTWAGGVNYFDRSYAVFNTIRSGEAKSMLNYSVVSAIVEDELKNLWIGTEGGGLNYYDRKSNTFSYYTNNPGDKNSIGSNNVKSIIEDHKGSLWIGTYNDGLYVLNPNKRPLKFESIELNFFDGNHSETNYNILAIHEDKNKNIWVGTLNNGLFFYNIKTKQWIKLNSRTKSVQCIAASKDSNIIVVGGTNGLVEININTREQLAIGTENSSKAKKYLKKVNCVFVDNKGCYWIGTEGEGLLSFNKAKKELIRYGVTEGLSSEVIYGVLQDEKNDLWVSTNGGLYQFNVASKVFKNFDESYGVQGDEFNYGAYAKTSNKKLVFGGVEGITYFDPSQIKENTFVPPVDIIEVRVNNKRIKKRADTISEIVLKHNQNDFSIDFIALSFSNSNKNQYAYKLEGYDDDWNYVGEEKMATYANIEDGRYLFKVKASNSDGVWNDKGAAMVIIIKPALWEIWWVYLIYGLTFLGMLLYIRVLFFARIETRNQLKREKLEKEKLEEINKLKLKFFTNISHEFRTPLTLIIGPLQQLMKSKVNNPEVNKKLQTINRNANNLLELINQLLDFRKREVGELKLRASKKNIITFIKDIKDSFKELAKRRHIKYKFKYTQKSIEVWFDSIEFKKVIINILSNAFKFSPDGGAITIEVSTISTLKKETPDKVKIYIQDTGIGIPKDKIKYIFDRYYQLGALSGKRFSTGLGLSLVKDIVERHHGTISVESVEGEGVFFTILLPLGDSHLSEEEKVGELSVAGEEQEFDYQEESMILSLEKVEERLEPFTTVFNSELPSILIVEDNEELRAFIGTIFEANYNVFKANNGKIGLEIARSKPIDLVISDVMMPEMDGIDMCHHIKSNIKTNHISVILLTAKVSSEFKKRGYEIGADLYITKPFDTRVLEIQVNNLMRLKKRMLFKLKRETLLTPKVLAVESLDEQFLKKAFTIVEESMGDSNFNVHLFTEKMDVSRTVLYKKLKALTGQSLTEFIRLGRLKKAAQLIANTEMNISLIAYEVGFSDLKYFRSNFKKTYNVTPSEYRKNGSKKNKKH